MFTGYKNIKGENIKLNSFQKILAIVGIASALAIFPYSLINQKIDVKIENMEEQVKGNGEEDEDWDYKKNKILSLRRIIHYQS